MESKNVKAVLKDTKKLNLMVVDDDTFYLKVLKKMFSRLYNVEACSSGIDALEILKNGFKPGVIISDQMMPQMNGAEFLEKSMLYSPDSTRIILTGADDSKTIISCINQGHAFMFLTKPSDNLELFQAAHIGFDHYKNTLDRKKMLTGSRGQVDNIKNELEKAIKANDDMSHKLSSLDEENQSHRENIQKLTREVGELSEKIVELEDLTESQKEFPNQAMVTLTDLIKQREWFYFTDHTNSVVEITKAICDDLNFMPEFRNSVMVTSLLHNIAILGMPDDIMLIDPAVAELNEISQYMDYFQKAAKTVIKIRLLRRNASAISQIWERWDGSGFPNGLKGEQISREAQIVAIANIYHNLVYRMSPEEIKTYISTGKVVQTPARSLHRHKEAIRFLYKKGRWFDLDIFRSFQDLLKHKESEILIPPRDELVVQIGIHGHETEQSDDDIIRKALEDEKKSDNDDLIESEDYKEQELSISEEPEYIEKEILTEEVRPGMISLHSIVTVSGILVVRGDTYIDENLVRKIKQLHSRELISEKLMVRFPASLSAG